MTQAVNLANFANNLDSSGGVNPSALNSAVPITKGGTGSTTASTARTALGVAIGTDVPSTTGTGASGTWSISISGNAATATSATFATSATSATNATNATTSITQASTDNSTNIATTAFVRSLALGVDQTWQDVTSSRAQGTTYTNSTAKPIMVMASMNTSASAGTINCYIDGVSIANWVSGGSGFQNSVEIIPFIVPSGSTYKVTGGTGTVNKWFELR